MKLNKLELVDIKEYVDCGNTDVYQLVVPILLPNTLLKDYQNKLLNKGFEKEQISTEGTLELQYLNVVQETYIDAFEYYKKKLVADAKFLINFASPQTEFNSKTVDVNQLEFDLMKYQIILNKEEKKEKKLNTSIYIVLTCAISKNEHQMKSIHYTNFLISSISTLDVVFEASSKIKNSQIVNGNEQIDFIHGSSKINEEVVGKEIPRIQYILDLFDFTDKSNIELIKQKINYPLGMNCYLSYYSVLSEETYNELSYLINYPDMDLTCDEPTCHDQNGEISLSNCVGQHKFCKRKYNSYLSVLSKFNNSKLTNMYVDDVEKLINKLVYKNFMLNGTLYLTGERSFGAVIKSKDDDEKKVNIGKEVFSTFAPAIFFSLNHKVLNISIQEQLKGTKKNSYDTLVKYHLRMEKYVFYEVTAESNLQTLYERMQVQHNNYRLFEQINNEIEIHQTRELNKLFERLTNIGIYLAVAALVISIPSYLATYDGVGFDQLSTLEQIIAYPSSALILTLISILITFMVLKRRR